MSVVSTLCSDHQHRCSDSLAIVSIDVSLMPILERRQLHAACLPLSVFAKGSGHGINHPSYKNIASRKVSAAVVSPKNGCNYSYKGEPGAPAGRWQLLAEVLP